MVEGLRLTYGQGYILVSTVLSYLDGRVYTSKKLLCSGIMNQVNVA